MASKQKMRPCLCKRAEHEAGCVAKLRPHLRCTREV